MSVLHGVLLDIFDRGVLLIGASGIGKSTLALNLLKRHHRLVADDAIETLLSNGTLAGYAPKHLFGFLATRVLGIIDISTLLGKQAVLAEKPIQLVIELLPPAAVPMNTPYLEDNSTMISLQGVSLPQYQLVLSPGLDAADQIEWIVHHAKQKFPV